MTDPDLQATDAVSVIGLSAILGVHPALGGPAPWPAHTPALPDPLELTLYYKGAKFRAFLAHSREATARLRLHPPESMGGWAVRVEYDFPAGSGRYTTGPLPSLADALTAAITAPIHIHARMST